MANHSPRRRLTLPFRVVRARPRLFIAALVGAIVIALAPPAWWLPTRLIVGWDTGVALYLIAACQLSLSGDIKSMRQRAQMEDEGRIGILMLTVIAALASLGAIVALLGHAYPGTHDNLQLALATATILLSWAFIHTMFALHYAHDYYSEKLGHTRALNFPGDDAPDYWDFFYFAFVLGMTSQVSDVSITSKAMRRMATFHGIVAFLFNAALLALMVNIAASAI
jgi:uncharacterized membrane protein